tara:strand:- start:407 stop:970 length:564 start_codon:yes stop_codon:yes gene_type:complete
MKTINLKGKQYATFDGVLDEAHSQGLGLIHTELIQVPTKDAPLAIVSARVKTGKGEFMGTGDATPSNVNRMIVPHLIRMAETRAIGRALRFATNAPTLAEELGEDVAQSNTPKSRDAVPSNNGGGEFDALDAVERDMEANETAVNKFMRHKGMISTDATWRQANHRVLKQIADRPRDFFRAVKSFAG